MQARIRARRRRRINLPRRLRGAMGGRPFTTLTMGTFTRTLLQARRSGHRSRARQRSPPLLLDGPSTHMSRTGCTITTLRRTRRFGSIRMANYRSPRPTVARRRATNGEYKAQRAIVTYTVVSYTTAVLTHSRSLHINTLYFTNVRDASIRMVKNNCSKTQSARYKSQYRTSGATVDVAHTPCSVCPFILIINATYVARRHGIAGWCFCKRTTTPRLYTQL